MPEKKPPESHFHSAAEAELRKQVKRVGGTTRILRALTVNIAANDATLPEELTGLVERKHVLKAAESLLQALGNAEQSTVFAPDVFLSYSTKDEDFARELKDELEQAGIGCFLAPLSIKPGATWPDAIWQAIRACRVFVLVVTADAIKSKWCLLEIGAAIGLRKAIIAVLRHSNRLPDVLKTVQAKKVQTKDQQADLVAHLKRLCKA